MGGQILADKLLPKSAPHGGQVLAGGPVLAAKISPAGPILAAKVIQAHQFFCQISPAGPILEGNDFGVTGLILVCIIATNSAHCEWTK